MYDYQNMTSFKVNVERKLIGLYNHFLNSNLGFILTLLDFILPKSNFDFNHDSNSVVNSSQSQYQSKITKFAATISNTSNLELPKNPLFIFITPEIGKNLSNSVCNGLAQSLLELESFRFIVITRSGVIVNSNFINEEKLQLEDILKLNPNLIFFEIHTFFKEPGLLSEEVFFSVKEKANAKIIGICFDIWRSFDIDCVKRWEPYVDYFIHMDQVSAHRFNLDQNKIIFWPYVGWVTKPPKFKSKMKKLFFSGNIKPSYRRSVLKFTRKICTKINLNFNVNRFSQNVQNDTATTDVYLNSLHESQFVLGLSQKTEDRVIVPFRSLEAIALGCTLIQQEMNDDTPLSDLFIPNEHYLSFKSFKDLESILCNIKVNYVEYVKIGLNSQKYMQEHYSIEKMWKYLLNQIKFDASLR